MAENRGNLTSYRPDIKVMDCTLRDGGLVNNFEFTDEFVKDLYEANVAAGVDYMEFGYKADKDILTRKSSESGSSVRKKISELSLEKMIHRLRYQLWQMLEELTLREIFHLSQSQLLIW